ncbi:MAG: hypothetical protein WBR26_11605 [Candidatus Acidiferrum sp.]
MRQPNSTLKYSQPSKLFDGAGGWYRRHRWILEPLQSGLITLFDAGIHDFICLNAQSRVAIGSSIPPGIWFASARKIFLLTGRCDSERRIQRALSKLEKKLGGIKRFHTQGQRGDYPILVERLVVSDGKGHDFRINAAETMDWQHPILEPIERHVSGVSVKRRRTVAEASPLLQDLKTERSENTTPPAQAPSQEANALAARLKERILQNDPKARITGHQAQKWAHDADLLMRRYGRSEHEIAELIDWCQQDEFWKTNILSMSKLREKFSQLSLKKEASENQGRCETREGSSPKKGAVTPQKGKYDGHHPDLVITN